ncbi:MAG: T9SS type A sorting domain-containing protein [Ignavibacteriae bacterium]|nr:T9SS type A sorting domain-containing protein [Ignavibacteriota bacterium]
MTVLKYILILAAAIAATANISFGQTYSLTPSDTVRFTGMMEDMQTLVISQRNTSDDTLQLKWKKISQSVPDKWETSVCDNQICYSTLVEAGTMNPVPPNESGFLLLHFTAHVNSGTATVRYVVWDVNYPASMDTLTFITTVENSLGISEIEKERGFIVSPNPVNNHLTITSDKLIFFVYSIVDIFGKKVDSGASNADLLLDTSHLPTGIYFLEIQSMNNRFIQKFIKQ